MIELERAYSALAAIDPGCSREKWIRIGMAAKAAGLSFEKNKASLGSNQTTALNSIKEMVNLTPQIHIDGVPEGKACLLYEKAVSIVAERMPTDYKHRKSSAKAAIAGLIGRGVLGEREN